MDFEKIYSDNYTLVYRFLLVLGADESTAEELSSECFFRAYVNIRKLRDPARCTTWLCAIAKNLYRSHLKKERRKGELNENETDGTDITSAVEEKLIAAEIIEHAMTLERTYAEVFLLHTLEGIPLKDISNTYGKSESWARVVFYRARAKIAERMGFLNEM